MHAKLVGVPGSHPCVSAELMLRSKGVEFTRLDLPNMSHKAMLPLLRHRGSTVPVMTLEGKRVSGTMRIARALDHFVPEPPLFAGADRATIEGAEAWADSVLQDGVRQLARYGVGVDPEAMASFLTAPVLKIPASTMRAILPAIKPVVLLQMRTSQETARTCLEALPAQLDRVDALLAEGVIGGERPNAADFQIAPSVRLMLTFDQLRPHIDARPAGPYARTLVPDYPGRFREVFPAQWLPF
jgi:glutathione S-transferase